NVISGCGTNIRNIGARTGAGQAVIDLAVDVRDAQGLEQILQGLKRIPGVNAIDRVQGGRAPGASPRAAPAQA
ncbi:MAG: ACT domain-containing protein, partial [Terriglobales bacterium]